MPNSKAKPKPRTAMKPNQNNRATTIAAANHIAGAVAQSTYQVGAFQKAMPKGRMEEKFDLDGVRVSLPEDGPDDREEYVNYALDMLVHNLISSGQLDPSKAYQLKTPEMKAHISRMADKVAVAKKEGVSSQISSRRPTATGTRWALQPYSLPITIITDKDPAAGPSKLKSTGKKLKPKSIARKSTNVLSVPVKAAVKFNKIPPPASSTTFSKVMDVKSQAANLEQSSLSAPVRLIRDGSLPMTSIPNLDAGSTSINEETKKMDGKSSGTTRTRRSRSSKYNATEKKQPLRASAQAFRQKLDMKGFNNEEISLDLDGRRLTITGIRPKREGLNARKATETIEIPEGINVDNLKIARRVDGILIIEESILDNETIL